MALLRSAIAVVLVVIGLAALVSGALFGFVYERPRYEVAFPETQQMSERFLSSEGVASSSEQMIVLQQAMLSAQREAAAAIVESTRSSQLLLVRTLAGVLTLLGISLFCFLAASRLRVRKVSLDRDTLAQLEMMLWESWVADVGGCASEGDDEFTVRRAAYPVHLCSCSSGGGPVSLCECESDAVPVHLCGCDRESD